MLAVCGGRSRDERIPLRSALSSTNTGYTGLFLDGLNEKHDVEHVEIFVDSADWLKAALHRRGYDYRYERHGRRNSTEHTFKAKKRRTY